MSDLPEGYRTYEQVFPSKKAKLAREASMANLRELVSEDRIKVIDAEIKTASERGRFSTAMSFEDAGDLFLEAIAMIYNEEGFRTSRDKTTIRFDWS